MSVALGLIAQFYPAPFPKNYYVLLVVCPTYGVIAAILQYMFSYVERDIIFRSSKKDPFFDGIQVRTNMQKYSYSFEIYIADRVDPSSECKLVKDVTNWFDENGNLATKIFLNDLKALLRELELKQTKKQK